MVRRDDEGGYEHLEDFPPAIRSPASSALKFQQRQALRTNVLDLNPWTTAKKADVKPRVDNRRSGSAARARPASAGAGHSSNYRYDYHDDGVARPKSPSRLRYEASIAAAPGSASVVRASMSHVGPKIDMSSPGDYSRSKSPSRLRHEA
eukprot:CAMPEP_0197587820 /NCGR_PEP_ID=MMETSP1326-20131121/9313_1 /TAXON_ID=1155430 /ORGANISM="Genus nov. species nov., Strain RCC2288" /LENGTH=148 /DNA_ID=CAMNT_0043152585 /DNA_START=365 /DNA_END=808 /DNA_ORIENTATION=-